MNELLSEALNVSMEDVTLITSIRLTSGRGQTEKAKKNKAGWELGK